jgi:hypothetical protein
MEPIADDVWTATQDFDLPGGVCIPGRMNVVRLSGGRLWVHSPLPPSDATLGFVRSLGPVGWIVSPSMLHHLGLTGWHRAFPDAEVLGPDGLAAKVPDVPIRPWRGVPEAWGGALDAVSIDGAPGLSELCVLHRPTGTLFVADLLFHLIGPMNLMTSALTTVLGTRGRLARSRVWSVYTKDATRVRASVAAVAAWPIQRLVPCHGAVLEDPGGARTRAALAAF